MFQHKLVFNLVRDLLWIECLERSVKVRVQSGSERIFDLGGTKKVLDTLSNFALKKSLYSVSTYIAFQPSQGLIQMNWGSREECQVRVQSGSERIFDLGGIQKKYSIRCQISRSKNRYIVFQHKLLFNLVKDLFKWIEGLERSVKVRVQSGSERIFDLGGIQKSTRYVVKFRAQKIAI